jgi:GGDEF domain-containing protein
MLAKICSSFMKDLQPAGELFTRFGVEEFAILLPAINYQSATEHSQRLLQNFLDAKSPMHRPLNRLT